MNQKIVVITGATGGLGQELVRFFLDKNFIVAAISRSEEKLDLLLKKYSNKNLVVFQADLTDYRSSQIVADKIFSQLGQINILVNCMGGYAGGKTVFEMDVLEWKNMMDLNLNAAFNVLQSVMKIMKNQEKGHIINISAAASFAPSSKKLAYFVSKSALNALTQGLAVEGKEHNINVNAIAPSIILTESNKKDMPNMDSSKWITPKEIFDAIQYLTNEQSKSVSGTILKMSDEA